MKKFFLLCALCVGIAACDNTLDMSNKGALSGKFTVNAAGDKVVFSKGNLMYQASSKTWQFAANQYDTIGVANENIADNYDGWIDLFGWGTGSNPTLSSTDSLDYMSFTDWGANPIKNGGNKANLWRTLTSDEMNYICYSRINADELRGLAVVNGVNGIIFMPDDWSGEGFTAAKENFTANVYSVDQWRKLEKSGAVFLPAAGGRIGKKAITIGSWGLYWLATKYSEHQACAVSFMTNGQDIDHYFLNYGFSVRLVRSAH